MKYTIELDEQDLQLIGSVLGQVAYAKSHRTIQRIEAQIAAQQRAAHDKAADAADRPSGAPNADHH